MDITPDFSIISTELHNFTLFNLDWLFGVVLGFFVLLGISRNTSSWKTLAFPVYLGLSIIGVFIPLPILIGAGFIYAIDAISINTFSKILEGSSSAIRRSTRASYHGVRSVMKKVRLNNKKKGLDESLGEIRADVIYKDDL